MNKSTIKVLLLLGLRLTAADDYPSFGNNPGKGSGKTDQNKDILKIYQKYSTDYTDYDLLYVSYNMTVLEVKEKILQDPDTFDSVRGLPVEDFVLRFDGSVLDDSVTLEGAGVKKGSYVFLKKKSDIP